MPTGFAPPLSANQALIADYNARTPQGNAGAIVIAGVAIGIEPTVIIGAEGMVPLIVVPLRST